MPQKHTYYVPKRSTWIRALQRYCNKIMAMQRTSPFLLKEMLPEVSKWSWTPPPSGRGAGHLNKALPYKVTSHRKNIDWPFKEAKLRYDMVFFLSKSRLIVTFLKSDSISIDQFSTVIMNYSKTFSITLQCSGPKSLFMVRETSCPCLW